VAASTFKTCREVRSDIATLTVVGLPASTVAGRTSGRKCCRSKRTSYSPAGSAGARNGPYISHIPVALFVMATLTFGITAPDSSVMLQEMGTVSWA
jgi:hypothetical protein